MIMTSDVDAIAVRGEPELPSRDELIGICVTMCMLREAGDWDRLAPFLTEDCQMEIPGIPGLSPFAGNFHGRSECIDAIRRNFTLIETVNLVPLQFLVEGDCVAISWKSGIRNRGTGPQIDVHGVLRLRFRGRQAYFYGNHFDTAAVAALAALSQTED
jgi:ketosteroid isomerase-like protein